MRARASKADTNLTTLFYFSFMNVNELCYAGRSPPSFSSDDNNRPGSGLKQTRLWVTGGCFAAPAWPRLAGSGDSRPAATQAAPTGETTGESRLVTPPCPLLSPSIHPLIYPRAFFPLSLGIPCQTFFFSYLPLPTAFVFSFHMLSHLLIYSNLISFHSSFTVIPQLPLFFHLCHLFFYWKAWERVPEDTRGLQLNTPVLSALVAGHTSIYDFTLNSIHLSGIAGTFGLRSTEFELLANCLDLHGYGCSAQFKIKKHILLSYSVFYSILRLNINFYCKKSVLEFVVRIVVCYKIALPPTLAWRKTN